MITAKDRRKYSFPVCFHNSVRVATSVATGYSENSFRRMGCRSDFNEPPVVFFLSYKLFNSQQFISVLYHVAVFTSYFNQLLFGFITHSSFSDHHWDKVDSSEQESGRGDS